MPPKSAVSAYGLWRLARFVSGKVLPKTAYPVLCGPLKGARFILGSAAGYGGGARTYFNLVEPEKTRAFMNIVGAGQVLFDIGPMWAIIRCSVRDSLVQVASSWRLSRL